MDAVAVTNTSIYEKRRADFEILLVDDKDRVIHDALVEDIYATWRRKEPYSGNSFFDCQTKNSRYVLTAMPDLVNMKLFYFTSVNENAVKIVFKDFENKPNGGGWGVMDSFTSECFRVVVDNTEFRAYEYPLCPPQKSRPQSTFR